MIDAGQKERQRLERNLHDGAQQRLVALSLDLGRLEGHIGSDADTKARLDLAREQIAVSLAELRDVARGIHPAVVSGTVSRSRSRSWPRTPRFLSISTSNSTNACLSRSRSSRTTWSARASRTSASTRRRAPRRVQVTRDAGQVVVEVVDDGVGGADTEAGSGLRGLADRVEALGGRLRIWTPSGGGTRVRAEIPCES